MIHLNGNILCAMDVETTGLDPIENCIWQFTCLPLTFDLKPNKELPVFDIIMQPIGEVQPKAISKANLGHAMSRGLTQEIGANLFHEWFERLPLGHKKRISVLAQNWPFDREFIKAWLGVPSFEYYFDPRYRDTMVLAAAICDTCDAHAHRIPFHMYQLRSLAVSLGIEWEDKLAHNSLYDCYKTAEVYRKLIHTMEFIHE